VFDGGWMRPQNDAGAFRSIALINYANLLIQAGQLSYVTQNLYVDADAFRLKPFFRLFFPFMLQRVPFAPRPVANALFMYNTDISQPGIKRDLVPPPPTPPRPLLRPLLRPAASRVTAAQDYIVNHWSDDSGDPWEEIKAQVFFVKHTYRHACILGSQLALFFKDADFAATLNATARAIEANINSVHWSDSKGYVMEIPAQRELDSAVHLAFLYGDSGDGFYTPGR
jgi:hypothetical protein